MRTERRWRGRWLIGVAVVHTVFALVVLREPLLELARRGLLDAVGQDPLLNGVTWFVFFGLALASMGQVVDLLEQRGAVPRGVGAGVLAMATLGVVLMPASGLWLLFPPAVSLMRQFSPSRR